MNKVAKIKYIEELLNELKVEIAEELNTKEGERLKELEENPPSPINDGLEEEYSREYEFPCRDKAPFKCIIVGGVVVIAIVVLCLTL